MTAGLLDHRGPLTVGQCATLACLLEAMAPKAGNVHPGAPFTDLTFEDFAVSAVAIAPAMEAARVRGVGPAVLDAIRATRDLVGTNTNLGAVLLIAPLAAVPHQQPLDVGVARVLEGLTADDCHRVYQAIRLAQPGGMGKVEQMDLAGPPPDDLLAAMRLAAPRDLVARQYAGRFAQVLQLATPGLCAGRQAGWTLSQAIVHTQLELLSRFPDSLMVRKCGLAVARQASERAAEVLRAGTPGQPAYDQRLAELDRWLRADGHRRNPGTTADLIAAGLFAALRKSNDANTEAIGTN